MKSIVVEEYGEASTLAQQSTPDRDPDDGEVRIDVRATGVNFADIEQRRGRYRGGPEAPFVPGLEGAGVIEAVGQDVTEWTVGDEVMCFFPDGGGYAETAVTDAAHLFEKPSNLSFAEAGGMLIQAFTAHNTLHEWGGLSPDDTVLINAAAGGVGSVATQLSAAAGATTIGTASTEAKRAFAADCGADHTIDYTEADVPARIEELTDGEGIDLLLDGVGGRAFADGLEAVRCGGTAVTYGVASGDRTTLMAPRLFYQNKSVVGYHLMNGIESVPERVMAAKEPLFDRIEAGDVTVTVEETYPLTEAQAAHEAIEARETRGRVVLIP